MRRAVPLLLVALALASCGGTTADREDPPLQGAPRQVVTDLDHVLALRSDFEAAKGTTRLLVLFSPT